MYLVHEASDPPSGTRSSRAGNSNAPAMRIASWYGLSPSLRSIRYSAWRGEVPASRTSIEYPDVPAIGMHTRGKVCNAGFAGNRTGPVACAISSENAYSNTSGDECR